MGVRHPTPIHNKICPVCGREFTPKFSNRQVMCNYRDCKTERGRRYNSANDLHIQIIGVAKWRKLILDRDGNKCVRCGSVEDLEVHHIVPLKQGGTSQPDNLITTCNDCHRLMHKELSQAINETS